MYKLQIGTNSEKFMMDEHDYLDKARAVINSHDNGLSQEDNETRKRWSKPLKIELEPMSLVDTFLRASRDLRKISFDNMMRSFDAAVAISAYRTAMEEIFLDFGQKPKFFLSLDETVPVAMSPLDCHQGHGYTNTYRIYLELMCLYLAVEDWLSPMAREEESEEERKHEKLPTPSDMFIMSKARRMEVKALSKLTVFQVDPESNGDDYGSRDFMNPYHMLMLDYRDHSREFTINQWYYQLLTEHRIQVFNHRTRQLGIEVLPYNNTAVPEKTRVYHSKNLLSLAWAEIMWAIDENRFARVCPICGGAFTLTKPYKKKTCSAECRKEDQIERYGGKEKHLEYFRSAKRRSRGKE